MDKSHKDKDISKDILSFGKYPMLSNYSFYYAYKKSSKLMSAIYILTDNEGLNRQIKDELRDSSKCLVKDILNLSEDTKKISFGSSVESRILFMHSLIDTALIVGIFDRDVASIFHSEYSDLHSVIANLMSVSTNDSRVSSLFENLKNDLNEENLSYENYLNSDSVKNNYKFEISKNREDKNSNLKYISVQSSDRLERQVKDNNEKGHSKPAQSQRDIQREEIALKVIKDSDGVSIKDISIHMPEISEKTVQRMLVSLLDKGSIRKEGERRWSRYYLV